MKTKLFVLFLLLFGNVYADTVTCSSALNETEMLFTAETLWPGRRLENVIIYDLRSDRESIEFNTLLGHELKSGSFKGYLSFMYVIPGIRNGRRVILFPSNFTSQQKFIAYHSNSGGSKFEKFSCTMQYFE